MAQTPAELTPWVHTLAAQLGIDPADVPTSALLNITRDVAHSIARPAGPITTYLMGVAIARGASYEDAAATVQELIAGWHAGDDEAGAEGERGDAEPKSGEDGAGSSNRDAAAEPGSIER